MGMCNLPYLILPYNMGKMVYRLALRPLMGPMCIPELTVRLQNPPSAVLTWVHNNTWNHSPSKWGPTHLDLPTNTHSQYLQENVSLKAQKHIHPGHHDQQNSKPGKSRRPIPESSIKLQNLQVQHSPLTWIHFKTGITSTWLQWPANCTPVKSSGHFMLYDGTKQHNPSRKSIPEEEDQARFSCHQLDRAGNPVISPSWARATRLVNPSFTDPWYYKLLCNPGCLFQAHSILLIAQVTIRKICFWGEN